jgi:hypothetical protein
MRAMHIFDGVNLSVNHQFAHLVVYFLFFSTLLGKQSFSEAVVK